MPGDENWIITRLLRSCFKQLRIVWLKTKWTQKLMRSKLSVWAQTRHLQVLYEVVMNHSKQQFSLWKETKRDVKAFFPYESFLPPSLFFRTTWKNDHLLLGSQLICLRFSHFSPGRVLLCFSINHPSLCSPTSLCTPFYTLDQSWKPEIWCNIIFQERGWSMWKLDLN